MKIGIRTFSLKGFNSDQHGFDFYPLKTIEFGIQQGFRHFEIVCDVNMTLFGLLSDDIVQQLLQMKNNFNLTYSVHLPFRSVELGFPYGRVSDAYIDLISETIRKTVILQPEAYVLHVTGSLFDKLKKMPPDSASVQQLIDIAFGSVKQIINLTGIDPSLLAVENLRFPFKHLKKNIEEIGLSVCMDVGHIMSEAEKQSGITVETFLEEYYDRITEIHLHDGYCRKTGNGYRNEAHLALGEGDLDYHWFIKELKRRNYDKVIILETELEDALISYDKIKGLLE